jgi:chaperone modulatory protein CbpM
MIDRQQFLVLTRLEIETLEVWIKEEWLIPREDATGQEFSDVDIARAHLIKDLKHDLGVNDEGIGVILNLIDQLHGLRRTLREPTLDRIGSSTLASQFSCCGCLVTRAPVPVSGWRTLVQMPSRMGLGSASAQVCCVHRSEMVHSAPNRLVGDR